MRKKVAALIVLLVIGGGMLATTETIAMSRSPPFPVLWSRYLSGYSTARVVHAGMFYSLNLLGKGEGGCLFQIEALNISSGSNTWLSKPFNVTESIGPYCWTGVGQPSLFPIRDSLEVVVPVARFAATFPNGTTVTEEFNENRLGLLKFDLKTGDLVSAQTVQTPGGYDYISSGFVDSNGLDIFAGSFLPNAAVDKNFSTLHIEAISPAAPSVMWNDSIGIPVNSTQDAHVSTTADSTSILVLVDYQDRPCTDRNAIQSCPVTYRMVHIDIADGNAIQTASPLSSAQSEVSVYGPEGEVIFRIVGPAGNQRIVAEEAANGKVLLNESAVAVGELLSLGDEVLYDYPLGCAGLYCGGPPNGYIAYSSTGQTLWSLNMDTGASMAHWSPLALSNDLILLSNVRTGFVATGFIGHLDYGGLYGSYYLVNATTGKILWKADYDPMVLPPFTSGGPAPSINPILSFGQYALFSMDGNTTQVLCVDVNQL